MGDSFKSDAKACGMLAVILTVAAYIIGSTYFYFTGSKSSVSWVFLLMFFIVVYAVLLYATRSYNDEYKAEKDLYNRGTVLLLHHTDSREERSQRKRKTDQDIRV